MIPFDENPGQTSSNPPASATLIPFDTHKVEARRAGDDGWFWPLERRRMAIGQHIRARMAEDLRDILRDRGPRTIITTDDLLRKGWTVLQIDRHCAGALTLAGIETPCGNDQNWDAA